MVNWWLARSDSANPRRVWWLALLLIVLVAAGLRYPGYDFSLPYIDHVDEPAYNLAARMIIDFGSAKPLGMHGYPPGIITVHYMLERAFHDPADPPGTIIWMVRLISITMSVLTVIILGLLAYSLSTPLAGLIAAWLWAVSPVIVELSRYATADPYVTFFSVLALYFAVSGTIYDRDRWTSWGVWASMGAVVFKYQAIAIVPVVAMVPLWRWFTVPAAERRRIWINWGYNVLTLAVFGFWLIAIYPTTEAHHSPDWSASGDKFGFPEWEALRVNFWRIIDPLHRVALWRAGVLGIGALLVWRRVRPTVHWITLLALLTVSAMWYGAVSLYGPQFFRQFVSVGAFLTVMVAVGLAGLASAVYALVTQYQTRLRLAPAYVAPVVTVGSAIILLLFTRTLVRDSVDNMRSRLWPDTRNALAEYADSSLPSGSYIGWSEVHKVFNRAWGGYPGETEFPLYKLGSITERPIADWQAEGVRYALLPYYSYEELLASEQWPTLTPDVLVMKTFPPAEKQHGPALAVLALDTIQYPATGTLGPIELLGYDLDQTTVQPGETITFQLYWRSEAALEADYRVYNHLAPLDARDIIAQIDGAPNTTTRRGTSDWADPDETIISRPFTLTIPAETSPGTYRLLTGFYHPDTWQRLTTPAGEDYLVVVEITVEGADS